MIGQNHSIFSAVSMFFLLRAYFDVALATRTNPNHFVKSQIHLHLLQKKITIHLNLFYMKEKLLKHFYLKKYCLLFEEN